VIQSTYMNPARERVALKPGDTTPWLDLVRASAPRARIEVVGGVGHFTQLEAADAVNRLIESFLEGL
jgi:pimeloyl-ACP methyl ester carboxylesterase